MAEDTEEEKTPTSTTADVIFFPEAHDQKELKELLFSMRLEAREHIKSIKKAIHTLETAVLRLEDDVRDLRRGTHDTVEDFGRMIRESHRAIQDATRAMAESKAAAISAQTAAEKLALYRRWNVLGAAIGAGIVTAVSWVILTLRGGFH